VQAVVKAHQGEFKVRSSKKGVSATIILPIYKLNVKQKSADNKSAKAGKE